MEEELSWLRMMRPSFLQDCTANHFSADSISFYLSDQTSPLPPCLYLILQLSLHLPKQPINMRRAATAVDDISTDCYRTHGKCFLEFSKSSYVRLKRTLRLQNHYGRSSGSNWVLLFNFHWTWLKDLAWTKEPNFFEFGSKCRRHQAISMTKGSWLIFNATGYLSIHFGHKFKNILFEAAFFIKCYI